MPLNPAETDTPSAVRQRKILLVDDEAGFTRLLKINLETTGRYTVRAENDSRMAVSAALEFEPDLVLMDMVMPGLNGGDLVNLFNDHPDLKELPIILLTATIKQAEGDERSAGVRGLRYLSKPLSLRTLMECLDRFFED